MTSPVRKLANQRLIPRSWIAWLAVLLLIGAVHQQHRVKGVAVERLRSQHAAAARERADNDDLRRRLANLESAGDEPVDRRGVHGWRMLAAGLALDAGKTTAARALLAEVGARERAFETRYLERVLSESDSASAGGGAWRRSIELRSAPRWIRALAVTDDRRAFAGAADGVVRVHDLRTGETLAELTGHRRAVTALSLSDQRLVSGDGEGAILVWDVTTFELLHEQRDYDIAVVATDLSSEGAATISLFGDAVVRVASLTDGAVRRESSKPAFAVFSLSRSLDDGAFAWTAAGGNVRAWDAETGAKLAAFRFDPARRSSAVAYDRGCGAAAVAASSGRLWIWRSDAPDEPIEVAFDQPAVALAFCDDASRLVAAFPDGAVHVLATDTGVELLELEAPGELPSLIAMSPDQQVLLVAGKRGVIHRFEAAP